MTVFELKREIANLPNDAEVILLSDSGSLDSVFSTFDKSSGKHGALILDGAYRQGKPIVTSGGLFEFSNEANKREWEEVAK